MQRARSLGFSIKEVEALLALWRDDNRASTEVKALASAHLERIEHKIAALESLRRTLTELVDRCHGDERPECPIVDELADGLGS